MIPKIIQAVKNQNVFLNTDNITISGDGTLENPISVILDNVRIELRESSEYIQWRYIGSSSWNNLVALSEIIGPPGDKGDPGNQGIPGIGVPIGGSYNQVLTKIDSTDYNTQWQDAQNNDQIFAVAMAVALG